MKLRGLAAHAWPHRGALALLALLTMANSLVMLAIPWLAGQLLGDVVVGSAAGQADVVGLLIAALAASALVSFAAANQSVATAARLLADLRQRIFEHVQRLPISFHESGNRGDLLALLTYETDRLTRFLTGTLAAVPSRLLTTAGAIILMFRIDARLALLVPLLIPAFYLILKVVGRSLRGLGQSLQRAEAEVVASAEQMLEMVPATKAFTRERRDSERYRAKVTHATALRIREGRIYAVLDPLIGLTAAVAAVLILTLAGTAVAAGQLTPKELFTFIFYAALLTRPVSALAHLYGETQTVSGTLSRMQSVLDKVIEPAGASVPPEWRAMGHVAFEQVEFAFPGRPPLLKAVTLDIAPGEIVALVGPNGAGKTALINLLLRYYEPVRGRVTVDGRDVTDLGVGELRAQIGLVPQMPLLFNGTIAENIAYGAREPTEEALRRAVRLAHADSFIAALPHGLDTVIGDRGARLSGGERQRIALARALIKNPPILVLDEATSMFDIDGESALIDLSGEALAGRTVILIAHRPATLALASRVFELADGQVTERSTAGRTLSKGAA